VRQQVRIPGLDAGRAGFEPTLEGLLEQPEDESRGGVVISHPHPLYGGTMLQPTLHHVAGACRGAGLTSLRFNFRGVGASKGRYSGWDERKDVRAAAAFLQGLLPAGGPLSLAGYSFGSLMSALAVVDGERPAGLALIAFVVEWDEFLPASFDGLGDYGGPVLAVCGEQDQMAPPERVQAFLEMLGLSPQMSVIEGADHFFGGRQDQVASAVADFCASLVGGEV
jgi:uncharacterized protein